MVNLTPRQIIVIGAAVVFGPPAIVGIIVSHIQGWFLGILAGVLTFLIVFVVAQAAIRKKLQEQKGTQDEDKHEQG